MGRVPQNQSHRRAMLRSGQSDGKPENDGVLPHGTRRWAACRDRADHMMRTVTVVPLGTKDRHIRAGSVCWNLRLKKLRHSEISF